MNEAGRCDQRDGMRDGIAEKKEFYEAMAQ